MSKNENPLLVPLKEQQAIFSNLDVQDVMKSAQAVKLFQNKFKNHQEILQREQSYFIQLLTEEKDDKFGAKIKECTPYSIFCAISSCISSGLSLDPTLGYGYLQPTKTANGIICRYEKMYQGKLKMLTDAGVLDMVEFNEVIYDCDEFAIDQGRIVKYKPKIPRPEKAKKIGAAIRVILGTGRMKDLFLGIDIIEKRKKATRSKKKDTGEIYGPWIQWEEEMIKKTMINAIFKVLPKSVTSSVSDAFDADDEFQEPTQDVEHEEVQEDEDPPTYADTEPDALDQKRYFAQLELDRCKPLMPDDKWQACARSLSNLPESRLDEMVAYLKKEFPAEF